MKTLRKFTYIIKRNISDPTPDGSETFCVSQVSTIEFRDLGFRPGIPCTEASKEALSQILHKTLYFHA